MVDPININDSVARVTTLIQQEDWVGAAEYLRELHPADQAELLTWLEADQQAQLVERLHPPELAGSSRYGRCGPALGCG
jgi:Mg/Co/Ni transporter MgtE